MAVDQNQPVSAELRRFTLLTHLSIGFGASCHPASTLAEGDCRGNNYDMKATTILAFLFLICAALPLYAADINDLTYDAGGATVIITDCDTAASGALVIPGTIEGKPVTSIGDYAFASCTSLTSITIPESVTSIGSEAFSYCSRLTSVTIPGSVTSIGYGAWTNITTGPVR